MTTLQMEIHNWSRDLLHARGVKPIYISISGSHSYGFPSEDSDYDIRCTHIQPTTNLLKLDKPKDMIEAKTEIRGIEIDLVSFEVEKSIGLLLQNNSNILENIMAGEMFTTMEHRTLKELTIKSLSKIVFNPYYGMAVFNHKKFIANDQLGYPIRKKYLYVFRALMAGIHVLKTGTVEPNLSVLNQQEWTKFPEIDMLVEMKKHKKEKDRILTPTELHNLEHLVGKLKCDIKVAEKESVLPDEPQNRTEIADYLYNIRIKNF